MYIVNRFGLILNRFELSLNRSETIFDKVFGTQYFSPSLRTKLIIKTKKIIKIKT